MTKQVLQVHANIDIANSAKTQWEATVLPGNDLSGIFAFGNDFADARQSLASMVAQAVRSGAVTIGNVDPNDLGAVRIMATTRKTFGIDALIEADPS